MTQRRLPTDFARGNHYVPQSYFRRWSADGHKVWAYRVLVPHVDYPIWELRSIRGLAVRAHLYTSVAGGEESDDVERWLQREVEEPALPVLDRLCSGEPAKSLTANDRKRLARYVAALWARSPLYYEEHTRMMGDHLQSILQPTMQRAITELEGALKKGKPRPIPLTEGVRMSSLAVKVQRGPEGGSDPRLEANIVVGREMWLDSMKRIINTLYVHLEKHQWQVLRPPPRWTWFTTDHPLLRLNFESSEKYDFKGGFGSKGTDLVLPLSPEHLLHARIGHPPPEITELPPGTATQIKGCIAQNAFRWIVADAPAPKAEWFMPRVVSLEHYRAEEERFSRYHEEQSAAQRELENPKDSL